MANDNIATFRAALGDPNRIDYTRERLLEALNDDARILTTIVYFTGPK
jgi:hypothetical protein